MINKYSLFGEPFMYECPKCGNKRIINIFLGSGSFTCGKCNNDPIRLDFIPFEEVRKNQKKFNLV